MTRLHNGTADRWYPMDPESWNRHYTAEEFVYSLHHAAHVIAQLAEYREEAPLHDDPYFSGFRAVRDPLVRRIKDWCVEVRTLLDQPNLADMRPLSGTDFVAIATAQANRLHQDSFPSVRSLRALEAAILDVARACQARSP